MRMSLFSTNHWSQSLFLRIYEGKALGTRLHANWKFVNILVKIFLLKKYTLCHLYLLCILIETVFPWLIRVVYLYTRKSDEKSFYFMNYFVAWPDLLFLLSLFPGIRAEKVISLEYFLTIKIRSRKKRKQK